MKDLKNLSKWIIPFMYYFPMGTPTFTENPKKDEMDEILKRANWLCKKMDVSTYDMCEHLPSFLGSHFEMEWRIYTIMFTVISLSNVCRLYPDFSESYLPHIEDLVQKIHESSVRMYDTRMFGEDALNFNERRKNSHLTPLSIIALSILYYKLVAYKIPAMYEDNLHRCCKWLNDRMLEHDDLNLETYSHSPIYVADMSIALAALSLYSKFYPNTYENTIKMWIAKNLEKNCDAETGLIYSQLIGDRKTLLGSYTALNCYSFTHLDRDFAYDQYLKMKKHLSSSAKIFPKTIIGIKEHKNKCPDFCLDPDAGPIIKGLSPSGTAWAIGAATFFEDWDFRSQLLRTAELAGASVSKGDTMHYTLSNFAIVGEAVTLAARTNFSDFSWPGNA